MAKNILVVDGSVIIRKLLRYALRLKGYGVVTAKDSKQAWDLLQKDAFDLVIIDIQVSAREGFQILAKVRSEDRFKSLPCLILIAGGDEDNKKKGHELGANSYLGKPFQPQQLWEKAEQLTKPA